MTKKILVTGGAGYIGSHMVLSLIDAGFEPVIIDNFSKSTTQNIETIEKLTDYKLEVIEHDIRKPLDQLEINNIDGIIHFAAFKAVGESVQKPIEYYENNVYGALNIIKWAKDNNVRNIIFSSTAAVYGNPSIETVDEKTPVNPINPYAKSKYFVEEILRDAFKAYDLNSVVLRYFNVAGNIEDGSIGESSKESLNLLPSLILSHLGIREFKFQVFGNDYPTEDGTCIRDYIHVLDLVDAHLRALQYLEDKKGSFLFNLGTSKGTSVMQIINAFEKVTGEKLNYTIGERRDGDPVKYLADSTLAKIELGWSAKRDINEMIGSMWKWYKYNFKR